MAQKTLHGVIQNLVSRYGMEIVADHRLKGLLADEMGECFEYYAAFSQACNLGVGRRLLELQKNRRSVVITLDAIKQNFAERSQLDRLIGNYVVDCIAYGVGLLSTVKEPSLEGTTAGFTRQIKQRDERITRLNEALAVQSKTKNRAKKVLLVASLVAVVAALFFFGSVRVFLMDTGRIPKSPELKNTRLLEACAAGDALYAGELLQAGAYIDAVDSLGQKPMEIAISVGAAPLVDTLRHYGSYDVVELYDYAYMVDSRKIMSHLQVERDHVVHTRLLFQKVRDGSDADIQKLLEAGVDLSVKDSAGENILFAAARGNNLEWAKFFVQKGVSLADTNEAGAYAYTVADNETCTYLYEFVHRDELFIQSIQNMKLDSAAHFLKLGADMNYVDRKNHYTAVHYAVFYNNVTALDSLISWGADMNVSTVHGKPIELAMDLNRQKAFKYLLAKFPEMASHRSAKGETLLHRGIRDQKRRVWVPLLLKAGADIGAADQEGNLPIHVAAQYGDSNLVKYFVEKGIDPKVENFAGQEVVDIADAYDNKEVGEYLTQFYIVRRVLRFLGYIIDFFKDLFG